VALAVAAPDNGRRVATILAFWLTAGGLIAGQYLLLRGLGTFHRETGQILLPSPWWRVTGVLAPLLAAGTGLVLQVRWSKGFWGGFAGLGLVAFVPFASLSLLVSYFIGPSTLETAHLPDGGIETLAVDPGMTDIGFVLVEDADPDGFVWRQVSELYYIPDGPYAGRPHLFVSPDARRLLVARGGIWTDVFRLVDGHPVPLTVPLTNVPHLADDSAFLRLRSARIVALAGLRP
jgi:hypothetical protein